MCSRFRIESFYHLPANCPAKEPDDGICTAYPEPDAGPYADADAHAAEAR